MRARLPTRRESETIASEWKGTNLFLTVSRDEEGLVKELFVAGHKTGSDFQALANDAAIIASIAMQYGAPLEALCASVGTGQSTSLLGHALREALNNGSAQDQV